MKKDSNYKYHCVVLEIEENTFIAEYYDEIENEYGHIDNIPIERLTEKQKQELDKGVIFDILIPEDNPSDYKIEFHYQKPITKEDFEKWKIDFKDIMETFTPLPKI